MPWQTVNDYGEGGWKSTPDARGLSRHYCEELERGAILSFPVPPFRLPAEDVKFLLGLKPADSRLHKNISYRPESDVLRGFAEDGNESRVHDIMRRYAAEVKRFVEQFLQPYSGRLQMDYASFRPLEEEGRDLSLHKRNDLLHVDAFPTRPTGGARILRIFTNINPVAPRVWNTTDSFDKLARQFAMDAGLGKIASGPAGFARFVKRLGNAFGARNSRRSAYDRFMLRFHNYLKENHEFQTGCEKVRIEFAPGATWIAFTDAVAHAVLSGQFALEQTYIIPREALVMPEKAPVSVLEKICGANLAN